VTADDTRDKAMAMMRSKMMNRTMVMNKTIAMQRAPDTEKLVALEKRRTMVRSRMAVDMRRAMETALAMDKATNKERRTSRPSAHLAALDGKRRIECGKRMQSKIERELVDLARNARIRTLAGVRGCKKLKTLIGEWVRWIMDWKVFDYRVV
jgi:hypothetical protein